MRRLSAAAQKRNAPGGEPSAFQLLKLIFQTNRLVIAVIVLVIFHRVVA